MDKEKIKQAVRLLLEAVGENPDRPDLGRTPDRVADMCEEIFSGIGASPEDEITISMEERHNEIVLIRDISFFSMCEHHMLPFFGKAHIAYLPRAGRITGLSKIIRAVELFSRRLQVQERLTTQIAETLMDRIKPLGVMVVIEAEHLCMSMRGVRQPSGRVITSAVRGIFRDNEKTRNELLNLLNRR